MRKHLTAAAAVLICLILGITVLWYAHRDEPVAVEDIKQMLLDVYTPESMEQFNDSKLYNAKFFEYPVQLDDLYTWNGEELTEADLSRKLSFTDIRISEPEDNSKGLKQIDMKTILEGDGIYSQTRFCFYINDNDKIIDFVIWGWD